MRLMYRSLLLKNKFMFNLTNIFSLIGFKIVWVSCVFGELYVNSWIGFIVGIFYIIIFFLNDGDKLKSFKIIIFFSILGYIFDSCLSFFELYKINAQYNFLYLPIWFITLWPSFACLLVKALRFLKNYPILSIFFGAFLGPATYYAGITLGIAKSSTEFTFLLISLFWLSMMFFYSKIN